MSLYLVPGTLKKQKNLSITFEVSKVVVQVQVEIFYFRPLQEQVPVSSFMKMEKNKQIKMEDAWSHSGGWSHDR